MCQLIVSPALGGAPAGQDEVGVGPQSRQGHTKKRVS
jgi:hypothetical protein